MLNREGAVRREAMRDGNCLKRCRAPHWLECVCLGLMSLRERPTGSSARQLLHIPDSTTPFHFGLTKTTTIDVLFSWGLVSIYFYWVLRLNVIVSCSPFSSSTASHYNFPTLTASGLLRINHT
jgi:hypothetical protein